MEIIVKSGVLKKVCGKIEGLLPVKPAIMITSGILFEVKETGVFLTATDLENTIRVSIESEKNKKGNMVITGKKFISLIKQLPDEDVKIIQKENSAEVVCKNSKYTFPCMDYEEFPKLPKFNGDVSVKLNGDILRNAIDKVRFCIDPDEPRPHFRGGLFDIKEDSLNFVGTDTKRLALFKVTSEGKYGNPYKCLLPFKLMGIISMLADSGESVDLSIGKNQIVFNFKDTYLVSQLLAGSEDFPDYAKVIPSEKQLKYAYLNREEFLSTLKRISLFTSDRYNKVKMSIGKNVLILSVVSPDVGEAHEKMDIEYTEDKEQDLAFPPNYLIDFLHKVEDERIILGFSSEKSPIILRGDKKAEYLYVAMPLKLD